VVHIHAVFNHACIATARACQKNKIPYVVRPLGTLDPWSMKQKSFRKKLFWELAAKKMLNRASAVHYTAQAELCAAERLLGLKQGRVVPLGIDTTETTNSESMSAVPKGHPYVLVLSRLHPKKGLDVLIEAFVEIRKRPLLSDWSLVIVGDGDAGYLDLLKRMVSEKHANEFVVFRGWLEGEEKKAVLKHASVLALPSHQENFGLCVLEAMGQGVPVLISPQVNLAEDIELAGAGWISAVDVWALEQSLVQALSDEGERNKRGRAGKDFSLNFSWDKIAEQLESMYSSVVASR